MIRNLLDWTAYWLVRGTAFMLQKLPLGLALGLGRTAGTLVYFFTKRRAIAYANLKSAFPESSVKERRRWALESFQGLAMNGVEILRFPILKPEDIDRRVTYSNYDPYVEFRRQRRAMILLTAHMGNWELSQVGEGIRGRPMAVLARQQKYRRLDALLNSFREHFGSVSVRKGAGIRHLIQTLHEGGCVGVLGDQSGGDDGVWVRFFDRLTTSPRGPMALALKLKADVIPVFCVRDGKDHKIFLELPMRLVETGDREKNIQTNMQNFMGLLESAISQYPAQWLWGHKRWKRTRTKRLTVLSDGKPGHVKQSEALVKEVMEMAGRANPPYEVRTEKIEVEFRSPERKRLFPFFALLFLPWAQGRLQWLRYFLTPESAEKIERASPDLVISAGASLVPINLCLARENLAKSAILMKPSFPFNFFRYDLALIPAHDEGFLPGGHFRTQGVVSGIDRETLESARKKLAPTLRDPGKVRFSLFLGGETRDFRLSLSDVENLMAQLDRSGKRLGRDYLVTTSRRTPEPVIRFLKSQLRNHPRCQLCVIATEDPRPEVVPGMMALADYLIVTEDSLSMISEALSSGKHVIVVKMGQSGLPAKHARFQEMLKQEWGIPVVEAARLSDALEKGIAPSFHDRFERERSKIQEKVEALF